MPQHARKSVYYAHAMVTYDHPAEELEVEFLKLSFPRHRIVNPKTFDGHPAKRRDTIGFCLRLVEKSEGVVFSRLMGKVTAGVGKEVNHALALGKDVFELKPWRLLRRKRPVQYLSRKATLSLYDKWRSAQLD